MTGALVWLFQRVSGAILVFGMFIHISVMHYGFSIPYYGAFKIIFLASVIFHGFYGLWGIAIEYAKSEKLLRLFQALIAISASLLMAVGIYIAAV